MDRQPGLFRAALELISRRHCLGHAQDLQDPAGSRPAHAGNLFRSTPYCFQEAMKALEFGLIVFGVMLNAAAQLLLKAGARSIGQFDFSVVYFWSIGWSLGTYSF